MSRNGKHAFVDPEKPRAFGICGRCSFQYRLCDLDPQYKWSGTALVDTGLKVCNICRDTPAPFLRQIILPPDPPAVYDPRPENYAIDETDFRITEGGEQRITEDDDKRITESSAG